MALVSTIKGTQVRIMIGDGESPETFAHPCMINMERSTNWDTSGQDEEIPDCSDPDAMAWNLHTKTGIKGTISGAGKLDSASITTFWDWLISDDAKNVRVEYSDAYQVEGAWKLTQFNVTGTRGQVAEASLTLVSHGIQAGSV